MSKVNSSFIFRNIVQICMNDSVLTSLSVFHYIVCTGNYCLDVNESMVISNSDLYSTSQGYNDVIWTFNTSLGHRINFTFTNFGLYWSTNYYSFLEIGDGLDPGESSRLAHFRGLDLPSNVTSVSNAAWMKVNDPRLGSFPIQVRDLDMMVTSVPVSGALR